MLLPTFVLLRRWEELRDKKNESTEVPNARLQCAAHILNMSYYVTSDQTNKSKYSQVYRGLKLYWTLLCMLVIGWSREKPVYQFTKKIVPPLPSEHLRLERW